MEEALPDCPPCPRGVLDFSARNPLLKNNCLKMDKNDKNPVVVMVQGNGHSHSLLTGKKLGTSFCRAFRYQVSKVYTLREKMTGREVGMGGGRV
jgi:hypothetical protein